MKIIIGILVVVFVFQVPISNFFLDNFGFIGYFMSANIIGMCLGEGVRQCFK